MGHVFFVSRNYSVVNTPSEKQLGNMNVSHWTEFVNLWPNGTGLSRHSHEIGYQGNNEPWIPIYAGLRFPAFSLESAPFNSKPKFCITSLGLVE